MTSEFQQPKLDETAPANSAEITQTEAVPVGADNTDNDDELSRAVVAAHAPKAVAVEPEKPKGPGKYQLDYVLKGQRIHETHETVAHAVSRVAALARIGIVPATSTAK